jgi:hypothetical protein
MFLVARLCDNDYAGPLENAMRWLNFNWRDRLPRTHPDTVKYSLIVLATAEMNASAAMRNQELDTKGHSVEYLNRQLKVTFDQRAPRDEDHDGGSVALDLSTNYIWRF